MMPIFTSMLVQLSFADSSEYAGEFVAGMNEGHGVLSFSDGVSGFSLVYL